MATSKSLVSSLFFFISVLLLSSSLLIINPVYSLNRRVLSPLPPSISTFLNPHNKIRAQYGLKPLKWSSTLANYAKWYAKQRRGDCKLIHSNSNYGENIFWGEGKRWMPADAISEWVAEKSYYNYKSNRCMPNQECLHYTQLVWKSTLSVGCAKIICTTGDTFITCNYDPHGNVVGQKPY
ncbi:Allergen V5/Tpx-1-related [Macleaya cordata]|uniref:Allergen V5/Tpx-1-related n=1 Tax=Macleaya cordata TaxID=56857 RepID=A0A200QPT3_MACCD|nr:Allergen V5/Tpx-1-related [Macleaya cordata]